MLRFLFISYGFHIVVSVMESVNGIIDCLSVHLRTVSNERSTSKL